MKRLSLLAIVFSFVALNAFSQETDLAFESYHKNIYGELMGSHIIGGVNYDMRLNKGRMDGIGFRAGIGGLSSSGVVENTSYSVGIITFPIEFNHLLGKRRSSFVSGIGILPMYASVSGSGELLDDEYLNEEGFGLTGGFLTLGYRFQPLKTGVMFQIIWNPLVLRGGGFQGGWIGLGLGLGFK